MKPLGPTEVVMELDEPAGVGRGSEAGAAEAPGTQGDVDPNNIPVARVVVTDAVPQGRDLLSVELTRLQQLRDDGALTEAEVTEAKAKVLRGD